MNYNVIRTEIKNDKQVGAVLIGKYETYDKAETALAQDVSDFREIHDNDERVDWDRVDVYDDIGGCTNFVWAITEEK